MVEENGTSRSFVRANLNMALRHGAMGVLTLRQNVFATMARPCLRHTANLAALPWADSAERIFRKKFVDKKISSSKKI